MKLRKIDSIEYEKFKDIRCSANQVYPMSIVEGNQKGDIFVGGDAVLLWHYCGFGYIVGNVSEEFLDALYEDFFEAELKRRLFLIADQDEVIRFFSDKSDIQIEKRVEYRYDSLPELCKPNLPIEKISADNIAQIHGRIIPSFSWDSNEAFLERGLGYVAVDGEKIAAVAFSGAVSSEEIDIGVETDPDYRNRGLAASVAAKMCGAIIALGKKPVWGRSAQNIASGKTAEKVGFIEDREVTVIRKK